LLGQEKHESSFESVDDVALSRTRYAAPLHPKELTCLDAPGTDVMGHVWTAPGCQGIDHVAALVGAAMCSAYQCGSQGRWP
jgi:hypothetical protein